MPGDVQTRIRTVTVRPSLLPTSQTRTAIDGPCGTLSRQKAGTIRGFHVPLEKYAGLGVCYRPGSVWATKTQRIDVLPASDTVWSSVPTTYACSLSRSLSQVQISSPYQLSSTHPVCGYQEGTPLAICTPHNYRRASLHCQGSSLFMPLDSPGGTGGSRHPCGNNFSKRPRVANCQKWCLPV